MMIRANIHEIKAKLSAYLEAVARGETVIIARRNLPVAEIRPIAPGRQTPRPLGQGPREEGYDIPDSFWEPLPEELLRGFHGEDPDRAPDSPT